MVLSGRKDLRFLDQAALLPCSTWAAVLGRQPTAVGPRRPVRRRGAGRRVGRAVQPVAHRSLLQTGLDLLHVILGELEAEPLPPQLLRHSSTSCHCRQTDRAPRFLRFRAAADDSAQQLLRHLAAVEPFPLLERAGHTGKVPCIVIGQKTRGHVLRTQDPGVVRQAALGVRPRVGIDQLPSRGDCARPDRRH